MIVIAHRGANKEALENSFKSFDEAIKAGCQRIEFDVRKTADNHIVVMHDKNLKRILGINAVVNKLTRKQLKSISKDIVFLDELIKKYHSKIELNIELKSSEKPFVDKVIEIIEPYHNKSNIIISSFYISALYYISLKYPEYMIACLFAKKPYRLGLGSVKKIMEKCKSKIIHPSTKLATKRFVNYCHKNGWKVFTYAELKEEDHNKERLWEKLNKVGVDGHCTNYPREFKKWMQKN